MHCGILDPDIRSADPSTLGATLKPAPFDYYRCETTAAAVEVLERYGDEAKVLAGGQSLVPMMNMRLARPAAVVDISRIAELASLDVADDHVRIGAGVRQLTVERSAEVAAIFPMVAEALSHVGHVPTRSRGTVCGSIAHADPAAELPAVMCALDATMVTAAPTGSRELSATEFFRSYFTTALESDEVLTHVDIPRVREKWGSAFLEFARRHGDFAFAGVAACLVLDEDRRVRDLRIVLSGVADVPWRASAAEDVLRGATLRNDETMREVELAVTSAIKPRSDVHATSDFRREIAGVLTRRALRLAGARAR